MEYNKVAEKNDWPVFTNVKQFYNLPTRIACLGNPIDNEDLDAKVTKHLPDQFILEYDSFFKLLSYYLPNERLRKNQFFIDWLRNTEDLAD